MAKVNKSAAQIAGKARSWLTRKARYGSSGSAAVHEQKYIPTRTRLARLVAVLSEDAILSEGKLAAILEMDRVAVRRLADDGVMSLRFRPVLGEWAKALMTRIRGGGA